MHRITRANLPPKCIRLSLKNLNKIIRCTLLVLNSFEFKVQHEPKLDVRFVWPLEPGNVLQDVLKVACINICGPLL